MFIVNQDNNLCIELKKVRYIIDWDNKVKKELEDIYNRMYPKAYNYGSTDNCLREIKREQDNYIMYHNPKKVLRIYANDELFATYKDIDVGIMMFDKIKEGIGKGDLLMDLSLEITQ